jgi:hypothetical protein
VAVCKSFCVVARSASGVFQSLGIAAASGKCYYLMIYAPPTSGLLLGDSAWASDPEIALPAGEFPVIIDSALFATSPTDDTYVVNHGPSDQMVTALAQPRT